MLQRDYILRMIEQCAEALARLLAKKKSKPEEAQRELDDASRSLLGLEPAALLMLSALDILHLFTVSGRPDLARVTMAIRVLDEAGELARCRGEEGPARRAARRAQELFTHALPQVERSAAPLVALHEASFAALAQALELQGSPDPLVAMALCRYYECTGNFARAEDRVFDLDAAGDDACRAFGLAFYRRLLTYDDDVLERGNLPRAEVEEGLARVLGGAAPAES